VKLIYISNSKLPASWAHGLQIMQMCAAFAKSGHDVELLAPRRVGTIQRDPFDYYRIERSFKITKIPCVDFVFLGGNKAFFIIQLISFLFFCRLKLLFRSYDVLYSREPLVGGVFKGVFLEIHSLPKNMSNFYVRMLNRSRGTLVLTRFIKERLVQRKIPVNKILVVPDAVNLEKFDITVSKEDARKKLGIPVDKKIIGYVGMFRTLGMEKGIEVLIQALVELKDHKEIILVLVGGHEEDINFYKNSAQKEGVADQIIFTGMVMYDVIPLYLKSFDITIAPFPDREHYRFFMSPLKIFEYMASGRPIVSADLPSLRDILNNSNSLLVSPGSSKELGAAIIKILGDSSFSSRIAAQARADVEKYTWDKRANRILFFIESIIKNKEAERENIQSFSSDLSVQEYSKRYLRAGEEYIIKRYMPAGSLVLDVGCGAGRTTSYIQEAGCGVVGVDIAAPLIREAKKNFPTIDFRVMDARKLDFKDMTFDTAFFSFNGIDNLMSFDERTNAIREIKRVLKPGGFFIYSSHNGLALPRTKTGWKIILNNLRKLRVGPHWRIEQYNFGIVTQYYNNIWNERARFVRLGFTNIEMVGNSKKLLKAPKSILAFFDKFPIYVAQKP